MTREEIKSVHLDQSTMLQEIKAANEGHYLEYKIKTISAKLAALGVNVEDLTL